ncbi:MAG: glycerol-3-phosphate acyltransferase [Dehalococcoidales bacterium]|nr:glycerol-3-phosphate acyltransferase [Dehalococcoidales bacterium]
MLEALTIIISYLLGSFPTAYIAGKLTHGVDIRRIGGGNMGALNAIREIGLATGLLVLLVDIAKGAGAVLIAKSLGVSPIWTYVAGFLAIIGHCWPVFLKFRGGKGAATAIGVYMALAPLAFACCLPVLLAVIYFTSNVTLGLTAGIALFPLFLWVFGHPLELLVYAILTAVFLGIRYIPTARRGMKKAGSVKDFIIEKNYKPWQTRKPDNRG